MNLRILQTILIAAALILGVTAETFNGQSLLALLLIGGVALLAHRYGRQHA